MFIKGSLDSSGAFPNGIQGSSSICRFRRLHWLDRAFGANRPNQSEYRPAFEQAVDRRSSGPAAAHQQRAHLDGCLARWPLRGDGECGLRNLRVEVRPVVLGSGHRDRHAGRLSGSANDCVRIRRSTPVSRSAATAATFTPAWPRSRDAKGDGKDDVGSGIAVYTFAEGKIASERLIRLPVAPLPPGRKTRLPDGYRQSTRECRIQRRLPSLARLGHEKLLVAENLSDDVVLVDVTTGAIEKRFDLSENDAVPSTYPVALAVTSDGKRAFVALWNASEIVELDLMRGTVARKLALLKPPSPIAPGTHPCAIVLSPGEKTLYVALANRDAVAAVDVSCGPVSAERLLRHAPAGAEVISAQSRLLWR